MQPSVIGMKQLERSRCKVQIVLVASPTAIVDGDLNAVTLPARFDAFAADRVVVRVAGGAAARGGELRQLRRERRMQPSLRVVVKVLVGNGGDHICGFVVPAASVLRNWAGWASRIRTKVAVTGTRVS